jgi:hypothetical protein
MNNKLAILKKNPITIIAFAIYCFLWLPLLMMACTGALPFQPVIVGEFPLAPIVTIPFSVVMFLNALFRKDQRPFYLTIAVIIYIPLFLLTMGA